MARLRLIVSSKCDILLGVCRIDIALSAHILTQYGYPYCVPLSIARMENFLYFHCAKSGKKIDCLKFNPNVCISCVGDTQRLDDEFSTLYESAIIFGEAEEVTNDDEKICALYRMRR